MCLYCLRFLTASFEKLDYGLLGLAALRTCRRNQAMIVALRRGAQQHKLCVVEFDGHLRPFAFPEPANPGPSLTRAPDRGDCRGEGFFRSSLSACGCPHTCSFFDRKPVLSSSASAVIEESELGQRQSPAGSRAGEINLEDCAMCDVHAFRSRQPVLLLPDMGNSACKFQQHF